MSGCHLQNWLVAVFAGWRGLAGGCPNHSIHHGHDLLAKVGAVVQEATDHHGMQAIALHPHDLLGLGLLLQTDSFQLGRLPGLVCVLE